MKKILKNYNRILLSSLCCFAFFSGCASKEPAVNSKESSMEDTQISADKEQGGLNDLETMNKSIGDFSIQDIEGNTYTQEMFADYNITMVNIFTTWCSPCINEIPDLEKLRNEMSDQGVNIVGIVLDGIDADGSANEEVKEKAKLLAEKTGASYPFLIPDSGYLNGRLIGIEAVPETFFVDKEGNMIGETYSGSRSFEDWKNIVETELNGVSQ